MFGGYKYTGSFHVLRGDVALILGMEFLISASPSVDWKAKTVCCYSGNKIFLLPTCSIGNLDAKNDNNSFAGLEVSDGAEPAPSED